MKKRLRWSTFGLTVKRVSLIKLPTKEIEGLTYLFGGMPFRAIPVALTQGGDPILVTINRSGVPEFTVKWMHDGPWNEIINTTPKAYLAGERCPSKRPSRAALLADINRRPVRQLIDELIYHTSMLDDGLVGPGPSQRDLQNALASRIRDSKEIERAFILSGDDLKLKSVWLETAGHYRTAGDIAGFMVALQNAMGVCTIYPGWGCHTSDRPEKWERCLEFMREHIGFVSSHGDELDRATYEAMIDAISKDT